MKAEFYKKNDLWIITTDEGREIQFPLELVSRELIEYWAKLKNKIGKDVGWETLSGEDRKKILDWFEEEVFSSKEFGEFLIDEITREGLEVLVGEEGEIKEPTTFLGLTGAGKGSYMELLKGNLSEVFKPYVKEVKREHMKEARDIQKVIEEISDEWFRKGEFDARVEAILEGDIYALEDLRKELEKRGAKVSLDEVIRILKGKWKS